MNARCQSFFTPLAFAFTAQLTKRSASSERSMGGNLCRSRASCASVIQFSGMALFGGQRVPLGSSRAGFDFFEAPPTNSKLGSEYVSWLLGRGRGSGSGALECNGTAITGAFPRFFNCHRDLAPIFPPSLFALIIFFENFISKSMRLCLQSGVKSAAMTGRISSQALRLSDFVMVARLSSSVGSLP